MVVIQVMSRSVECYAKCRIYNNAKWLAEGKQCRQLQRSEDAPTTAMHASESRDGDSLDNASASVGC